MTKGGPEEPYLRLDRVSKAFGSFVALKEVSFEVPEGELVCFLGPSGCGKTTLLRVVAGLDSQTAGRIFQAGREISTLPPSERNFGIVFQSYALFPNLTVRRNIAYGLRRMSRATAVTRVDELLDLVGLSEHGKKYPGQLSGGQQQRVALARALAISPNLLLLDEPLSALDARVREHLRYEIRQLQHRLGLTTILVTHDQGEALTMADRIVVMNDGEVRQIGTPQEIYQSPCNRFVADFVGTMNFLKGVSTRAQTLRIGQTELRHNSNAIQPDRDVSIAIRPEDVLVRNIEHDDVNAQRAQVAAIEYLGMYWRVRLYVQSLGQAEVLIDVSGNVARELEISLGRDIQIAFPPERLIVFSDH